MHQKKYPMYYAIPISFLCSLLSYSFFVMQCSNVFNSSIFSNVMLFKSYIRNVMTSSKITHSYALSSFICVILDWGVPSPDSDICNYFPCILNLGELSYWVNLTYYVVVTFRVSIGMTLNNWIKAWITSCFLGFSIFSNSIFFSPSMVWSTSFSHLFVHRWHE